MRRVYAYRLCGCWPGERRGQRLKHEGVHRWTDRELQKVLTDSPWAGKGVSVVGGCNVKRKFRHRDMLVRDRLAL
jgi:hypothetical protein